MESVVKCCVCNERMDGPIRTMPCLHSGCLQCLETCSLRSLQDGLDGTFPHSLFPSFLIHPGSFAIIFISEIRNDVGSSSREIKCPKCHGPFQVPKRGVEDLPTNYFTAGVVNASIKKESMDLNNIRCELCEENGATFKCKQCDQFQCDSCQRIHLRTKATSQHQFITIDEALKGGSASSAPRILHCQKHPQYEVNSYCKTDQTAVCPQCAVDFHRGHDVDLFINISKGFKDTISTLMSKVRFPFFLFFLFSPPT